VLAGEVDWAVEQDGATGVEDVLYRRTRSVIYEPRERDDLVRPVAERVSRLLNWSPERTEEEVAGVRARLDSEFAFSGPEE
jgi:glycerol-3-phosphate dehydrogenase